MKTTIIDLLNKIANNEQPPKKIVFKDEVYEYDETDGDYRNVKNYEALFDSYVITDILNDEVEILETTITYNQDSIENNKQDKIEKLIVPNPREWLNNTTLLDVKLEIRGIEMKINKIIEHINEEVK